MFPAVLKYLGKDPNSANTDDYKALALLKQIRPYIRQFSSSGYIDELAVGDLCMVYGFSGDVMIARRRPQRPGSRTRSVLHPEGRRRPGST